MAFPFLSTKLYRPPLRPGHIGRARLRARLMASLAQPLVLVSAPAGFGKTTVVAEWMAHTARSVAWLALDETDNDPLRFWAYFIAALQTVQPGLGQTVLRALQTPQPPPLDHLLTTLLNELATLPTPCTVVLDDYHLLTHPSIDQTLAFWLDHWPPPLQLILITREDPALPLPRLRARAQLAELRAADLRFTPAEAAAFLNDSMGLHLTADHIAALEARTEGWVVGLQLAALSMQGRPDPAAFIDAFAGSHHFVLDYLMEEVLHKQPPAVQTFLLQTSVLERLNGALCEAVVAAPPGTGQTTLEYLEQANLFIVPLDNTRQWYRYHHLFADLLRQRLQQTQKPLVNELHRRASQWFEDHQLEIEAFRHATAANDIDRAERLIVGRGLPLHLKGAVVLILEWFAALPLAVFNARPILWWRYASLLLVNGHTTGVAEKLDAAEAAIKDAEPTPEVRHLIGRIATARAVLALTRYAPDEMMAQSRRALEYLPPSNAATRANAHWTMGQAHIYRGERAQARTALTEAVALGQTAGDRFTMLLATIGLGLLHEGDLQLHPAAQTYRQVLQWVGDQPLQIINEVHLGLARLHYEWNDLTAAQHAAEQSLQLAHQYDTVIDRFILSEVFLARLQLARGEVAGAAAALAATEQAARQRNFVLRLPDVAAVQVLVLLQQNRLDDAAQLAQRYPLPFAQARVLLAQGEWAAADVALQALRAQMEQRQWVDDTFRVCVLQTLAAAWQGDQPTALAHLAKALALAEPGGLMRAFVDEGPVMRALLTEALAQGLRPAYVTQLLAAFPAAPPPLPSQTALNALSPRELEVLRLIAQGLSNEEIARRLFLALDTVKGHNRKIFEKLHVQRRTEAVAQAQKLGLL